MARGKLLKTKVKEALTEASIVQEAIKVGSLKAEQKVHEKKTLLESAKEHIGKMIDRIDPLEALAMGFTTFIVHDVLVKTEEFLLQFSHIYAESVAEVKAEGKSGFWWENIGAFWGNLPVIGVMTPFPSTNGVSPSQTKPEDSIMLWAVSFIIAFLIIRYGDKILEAFGGIAKLGMTLISSI